jgi:hypothetical protein
MEEDYELSVKTTVFIGSSPESESKLIHKLFLVFEWSQHHTPMDSEAISESTVACVFSLLLELIRFMNHPTSPVYFYLPRSDWRNDMPSTAHFYWDGFRRGIYCWTVQTYLHLSASGFPCELVDKLPDEGIILAHWDALPVDWQPGAKQLMVCIQADRARHPYAQVHIVQNLAGLQTNLMLLGDKHLLPGHVHYVPHWPQPGLIPRHPERSDRFKNIAFFGLEENLVTELRQPVWQKQLDSLGLRWCVVSDFKLWNNYSEVDAVLAVRSFDRQRYTWKPGTKLYNAWHAGVPAILGYESAFRAERKTDLDYLEVKSVDQAILALKRLRDEPELRQAMVQNGQVRAQETSIEQLTVQWTSFLTEVAMPAYYNWCKASAWGRQSFLVRRSLAIRTRENRKSLQQMRNSIGLRTRVRSLLSLSTSRKASKSVKSAAALKI